MQFIPLTVNADMLERIELQGKFDKLFSGGAKFWRFYENQNMFKKIMHTFWNTTTNRKFSKR